MIEENIKTNDFQKLQKELGNLFDIVKRDLYMLESIQACITFSILHRIDTYIGEYKDDMAECYARVKDMDEDTINKEMFKVSHNEHFYNYSGINFNDLLYRPDGIDFYLYSYAEGFNKEVREVLYMLDFNNIVAKMKHFDRLVVFLNECARMELGVSVSDLDICEAFRNAILLRDEYVTPQLYCDYAGAILFAKNRTLDHVNIYDPVCGTGNLLNDIAIKAYSLYGKNTVRIFGQDINKYTASIVAACNLILGDNPRNIKYGNTIIDDMLPDNEFQYIVADLPMGVSWKNFAEEVFAKSQNDDNRFSMGFPRTDCQLLFIQHIISKMSVKGSRAVVFTNSQPLTGGDSNDSNIRKAILEKDLLETVIALPNTSGNSNVQRFLWVLSNDKTGERKGKVQLIDASYIKTMELDSIDDKNSLLDVITKLYTSEVSGPYSKFISNEDFGCYNIEVRDTRRNKNISVEVPMYEDPNKYLEEKNLMPNSKNGYEILYDKTTDVYRIDIKKYFSYKEENRRSSKELQEQVSTSIMSVIEMERNLSSMDNLEPATDLVKVNNGVYNSIPSHWKGYYLTELVDFINGKKYIECIESSDSVPVLAISDFRDCRKSSMTYTQTNQAVLVDENDVVIVSKGSKAGDIVCGCKGALGNGLMLAKRNSKLLHEDYLYYLLSSLRLDTYAKGVIKYLSLQDLEKIYVYIPSVNEQEKMVEYMYKLEGIIGGTMESLGVIIPCFEDYLFTMISEIVTGKYDFSKEFNNSGYNNPLDLVKTRVGKGA